MCSARATLVREQKIVVINAPTAKIYVSQVLPPLMAQTVLLAEAARLNVVTAKNIVEQILVSVCLISQGIIQIQ